MPDAMCSGHLASRDMFGQWVESFFCLSKNGLCRYADDRSQPENILLTPNATVYSTILHDCSFEIVSPFSAVWHLNARSKEVSTTNSHKNCHEVEYNYLRNNEELNDLDEIVTMAMFSQDKDEWITALREYGKCTEVIEL